MSLYNIVFLLSIVVYVHTKPTNNDFNYKAYLEKYGYIKSRSTTDNTLNNWDETDDISDAIEKFQKMSNIPITGILDETTKQKMHEPRCGLSDVTESETERRKKRYVLWNKKWNTNVITYRIDKYTNDLSKGDIDRITSKSFNMWSKVSALSFRKVNNNTNAIIVIKFVTGNHGDGSSFDNAGGVLAHAFYPYGGDAHFDDAETWSLTGGPFGHYNLLQVMVHEFGHSLGLRHSDASGSAMQPFYSGYLPHFKLGSDDIKGIQALYGRPGSSLTTKVKTTTTTRPTNTTTSTTTTTPPTTTTTKPITTTTTTPTTTTPTTTTTTPTTTTAPTTTATTTTTSPTTTITEARSTQELGTTRTVDTDICEVNTFDAITSIYNGDAFGFIGNKYIIINEDGIKPGYPRLIKRDWSGLPDNIDAAITLPRNYFSAVTYYFKGEDVWKFSGRSKLFGPVKSSTIFKNMQTDIDYAFYHESSDIPYYVKDDIVYELRTLSENTINAPRHITNTIWRSLPTNQITASFYWGRFDATYYFVKDKYYKLDPLTNEIVNGYPMETGHIWLGCSYSS